MKACHLVGLDLELRVHREVGLRVDRHVREEVAPVATSASPSSVALPSFLAGSEPPNQEVVATRFTPGTAWMRVPYDRGTGNTRLTACRVTSRLALMLSSRPLISASTDCSVQNRKMHTDMARTVDWRCGSSSAGGA